MIHPKELTPCNTARLETYVDYRNIDTASQRRSEQEMDVNQQCLIDGLVQDCSNSSASATELLQSCT